MDLLPPLQSGSAEARCLPLLHARYGSLGFCAWGRPRGGDAFDRIVSALNRLAPAA